MRKSFEDKLCSLILERGQLWEQRQWVILWLLYLLDQPLPGLLGPPGLKGQGMRGKKWNVYLTVTLDIFIVFQLQGLMEHKHYVAQVSLELMVVLLHQSSKS